MLKQILWDKPKVEVFIDLAGRDLTSGSIINISASEIAKLDKHFIFKIKDGDIINTYTEYHIDNEDGLKIIIDLLDFENSHYVITGNTLTYDSGDGYFMDTDKTLSIANLPADAKATGDAIKAVEDEVDDVKTDLSDYKVDIIGYSKDNLFTPSLTYDGGEINLQSCTATINEDVITLTATRADIAFGMLRVTNSNFNHDGTHSDGYPIDCTGITQLYVKISNSELNKNYISFFNASGVSVGYSSRTTNEFTVNVPASATFAILRIGKGDATVGAKYSFTCEAYDANFKTLNDTLEQFKSESENQWINVLNTSKWNSGVYYSDLTVHTNADYYCQAFNIESGLYKYKNLYNNFCFIKDSITGTVTALTALNAGITGLCSGMFTINNPSIFYVSIPVNQANDCFIICKESYKQNYRNGERILVTVGASAVDDFQKLSDAIIFSNTVPNCDIYVRGGTYNLITELGDEFFANMSTDDGYMQGLNLGNGVRIIFASNAKVLAEYTGENTAVMECFSAFNLRSPIPYGQNGFVIENLNLKCKNIRYGVHDEANSSNHPYRNIYKNCRITVDNRENTAFTSRQCIGGGLGSAGEVIVENCIFESLTSDLTGTGIVSYHNGGSGRSNIVIKDSYFKGKDTAKASWHGTSTDVSTMIVTNCSVGANPYVEAEEAGDTVENMELIAWNNEIRS